MGGGYYSGDVAERSRSTNREHFQHTEQMLERPVEERECHKSLDPKGKIRECLDAPDHPKTTPIPVIMDLTRSRGEDAKVIFGKLPMMIGQMKLNDMVPDPELLFMGVGDATTDRAPLQVGQFESDNRLDTDLANMWLELGGGGTGQESYQLAAYFLARRTKLDSKKRGEKGVAFFLGDEGFYPEVNKGEVERVFGEEIPKNIPSSMVFAELQQVFDTYLIFPKKSWEERRGDIDEEIAQRVRGAGGMVEGVDVRFSLIWHNRNDLDLHVQGPDGHHIYYGSKVSPTGGMLDVDKNVSGETTKPVENTRWAKGKAPKGTYKVWVENYRFHETREGATEFKVEIEIDGEVQHFTGKTAQHREGSESSVSVGTFTFNPGKTSNKGSKDDKYAGYNDATIKAQWATVLPPEHVLEINDPKAAVDIMLGVLWITRTGKSLESYLTDMKARGQSEKRIEEVKASLANLGERAAAPKVDMTSLPQSNRKTVNRRGSAVRL